MGDADWKLSLGVGVFLLSLGGCAPGEEVERSSSEDMGPRTSMERGRPGPSEQGVPEEDLNVVVDLGLERGITDQSSAEDRGRVDSELEDQPRTWAGSTREHEDVQQGEQVEQPRTWAESTRCAAAASPVPPLGRARPRARHSSTQDASHKSKITSHKARRHACGDSLRYLNRHAGNRARKKRKRVLLETGSEPLTD